MVLGHQCEQHDRNNPAEPLIMTQAQRLKKSQKIHCHNRVELVSWTNATEKERVVLILYIYTITLPHLYYLYYIVLLLLSS